MKGKLIAVALVVLVAAGAAYLLLRGGGAGDGGGGKDAPRKLAVLCAAGIRPPMEAMKAQFEKDNACRLDVTYEGSGTLLTKLDQGVPADVYLPGDIFYIRKADGKGLLEGHKVVAWFVPVIAVQKGNPKGVRTLKDLSAEGLRVGLGQADACAIGNVSRNVLASAGVAVKPQFEALTVNRLANQIKLKTLDAALIWDATATQYPEDVEAVPLENGYFHAVPFAVGVVKGAKNQDLALRFAEFAAGEAGAKAFRDNGYQVPGPRIRVGCGGSMRPPVEELARKFEAETGREVLTNYGGSGTVLLQIEESKEGDVYVCHDPYAYKCDQKKISAGWHTMAYLEPIIAVQKGNPKKVKGLKDLLRPDLKLGLSHRKYSTRGQILWEILRKNGLAEEMEKRKAFEDRKHSLVNQLKLGAVDVATLWDAPARAMEEIDVVPIEDEYKVDSLTSATSGKTYSLKRVKVTVVQLTLSKEPLLTAQFAKMCVSEAGREILKKHEFRLPPKP